MSNSAYWNSQYRYYMDNQPPKAESYYNKSFVDKINEASANIDNLVAEKDKSWAATQQARDDYNAFKGTISEYNEVYKQAESEFGVTEHHDNYEKSKKALALAESTLAALPSTINASSNRVLTQSQREARYNALSDRQTKYNTSLMSKVSAYEDVWKQARENQAAYAQAEIAGQWKKLDDYNNAWTASMNEYNQAEKRLTQARIELRDWQSQYRSWQNQQYQNANTIWYQNMSNALNRYVEALNTEMVIRQAEAQKAMSDSNARLAYSKSKLADSMANYYYTSQEAKKTQEVVNAGGAIGRLAYLLSR